MSKFKIVCNEAHYDEERDALATSGKLDFYGEPAEFEYMEKDGRFSLSVVGKDFEVDGHVKNFPSVSGYGLSNSAVQEFLKDPDAVHNAVREMVDDFCENNHDARIARLNYAAPEIDAGSVGAHDLKRCEGDVGDYYGQLHIEAEPLRFTADRDGSIRQIAFYGEPLQDAKTFGFGDKLMEMVENEVRDVIAVRIRQEERGDALKEETIEANERSSYDFER